MSSQSDIEQRLALGAKGWNKWRSDENHSTLDMSDMELSNRDLAGYDFSHCVMSRCQIAKTNLSDASFIRARLDYASLVESNLSNANLIASDLSHANFSNAVVFGAKFLTASLNQTNFSFIDFVGLSLQGLNFSGAKLHGSNLAHQNLSSMDLSGADLSLADLTEATLQGSNLQKADFSQATLTDCVFQEADLRYADFTDADLTNADFSSMNLKGVCFKNCDLRNASFENSKLDEANFDSAKLYNITIAGWSIRDVICKEAYWDKEGIVVSKYRKGDFERLHSEPIVIDVRYDKFLAPHEFSTLPILVEHLEASYWGIKLRIKTIEEVAGGSLVKLVVQDTGGHNTQTLEQQLREEVSHLIAAQMAMRNDRLLLTDFKEAIANVKNDFWPKLLELAADNELGQMRTYTVMLLDLGGFSRWKGEELAEKLSLFRGLVQPILKRWKANHPNMEGDSLRASFQNASVGVACACMIRNVLVAAGFNCRIGLDLGEVTLQYNEVTEQTDISGEAVSFAARLESMCDDKQVIISERVWHVVNRQTEYFMLTPLVKELAKGVGSLSQGDRIQCYQVDMIKALI
ncbi:MAG: pentapeptide repeat-containing protein [Kangiellaceae bacterium]|jgi:uncharacterized protein YjbI with pentapeptide repeats/class 3 adenylate cyclase|nr:pentapeptide repeat-containing protein [Kangiellaceae bacterium]